MHAPRRRSLVFCIVLSLVTLMGSVILTPATAHAAGPVHENFSFTQPGNVCGIPVTVSGTGVSNLFPIFDASGTQIGFKELLQEQDTITAANGQFFTSYTAGQQIVLFATNPDGTHTITVTEKGMQQRISIAGGPALLTDVGFVSFVLLFDSSFNFISQTILVEHGVHQNLDSNGALFCQVVIPALS
jgi:hypothetical protein